MIRPHLEQELYRYLTGICENSKIPLYSIGGMPDHIHLLTGLPRTLTISDLVAKAKSSTSKWAKGHPGGDQHFTWQKGYGAFSVSQSHFEVVDNYIRNQKEHHANGMSFKEEFLKLLERHQLKYDERYVWD